MHEDVSHFHSDGLGGDSIAVAPAGASPSNVRIRSVRSSSAGRGAGVRGDGGEQRVAHGAPAPSCARSRRTALEALEAERLAAGVGGLDESVGEEDDEVAGLEAFAAATGRISPGKRPRRRRRASEIAVDVAAADEVRRELAGVREHGLARARVVGEEGEGHVVPGIGRAMNEVVQPLEELAAVVPGFDEGGKRGLRHRDEQAGRQAVARDVAERERRSVRRASRGSRSSRRRSRPSARSGRARRPRRAAPREAAGASAGSSGRSRSRSPGAPSAPPRTSRSSIEAAIPSNDRARSPIWSRDVEFTRTVKSPAATARVARVRRLTLRAIEPTRTKATARATAYTRSTIAARPSTATRKTVPISVDALREELAEETSAATSPPMRTGDEIDRGEVFRGDGVQRASRDRRRGPSAPPESRHLPPSSRRASGGSNPS